MHVAEIIKERVTAKEVCARYGIPIDRKGFALCVAHNDTRPSMKIYDGNRGWYCFACNTGGDVISLVHLALGIDYKTAINRINDDFGLNLPINCHITAAEREAMEQEAEKRNMLIRKNEAIKRDLENEYLTAFEIWWKYEKNRLQYAPKTPEEE